MDRTTSDRIKPTAGRDSITGAHLNRDVSPWTAAILLAYVLGFCLFSPVVFTSTDEPWYVEQAIAFARGSLEPVSLYPPGTSILQAPLVAVGGWRAAAGASVLSLAITVLCLGRWLRSAGYAPAAALLVVAYAPTLVMGRLATSDLPSAAIVTVGLWLFWTGSGDRWRWLLAGMVAGLSLLLREANVAILLPFILGAVWRREPSWRALAGGAIAGLAAAILLQYVVIGSPVEWAEPVALWSLAAALESGPLYAFALLVLVPGGLIAVWTYRGPRWRELQLAFALFLVIYLFYGYSGQDSGPLERVAVAGRYFIPLVPLIALAWADAASRYVREIRVRRLAPVAGAGLLVAAFAVHPVMHAWSAPDAAIVRDIVSTSAAGVVIADIPQRKFVAAGYGPFTRRWMIDTPPASLGRLIMEHPRTYIVWVSRSDTPSMEQLWATPRNYVEQAAALCQLEPVRDGTYGAARRLQVWRVRACGPDTVPGRFTQ